MKLKVGDIVMVLPTIHQGGGYYSGPILQPLTIIQVDRRMPSYGFKETGQRAWAPYVVPCTSLMKELI